MNNSDFGFGHASNEERDKYDRFLEFHRSNPAVFALFKKYALELLAQGFQRYSSDALLHSIRYMYDRSNGPNNNGRSKFPLVNDHYSTGYADLLKDEDKRFEKFFPARKRGY
jgi:hypothetical protein